MKGLLPLGDSVAVPMYAYVRCLVRSCLSVRVTGTDARTSVQVRGRTRALQHPYLLNSMRALNKTGRNTRDGWTANARVTRLMRDRLHCTDTTAVTWQRTATANTVIRIVPTAS